MTTGLDSSLNPESQDPYELLGLDQGASFDEVQKARDEKLKEVGEDPQARARIEASFDRVLMASLKQRQQGNLSTAAENASKKEEVIANNSSLTTGVNSLFSRFGAKGATKSSTGFINLVPSFALVEGQGLLVRFVFGLIAFALLLVTNSASVDLILPLCLLGTLISQIKRGRPVVSSLGWSVVSLSIGLMLGSILYKVCISQYGEQLIFTHDQIQAIPAVLILWLASLFID